MVHPHNYWHADNSFQNYRASQTLMKSDAKKKKASALTRQLQPTEICFYQNYPHCVFQKHIWLNATHPVCDILSPTNFSYKFNIVLGCLKPVLMTQPVAAPGLLNDIVCSCKSVDECTCFLGSKPCDLACTCEIQNTEYDSGPICTNIYSLDPE